MATGLSDESEFMRTLWFGAEILSKVKVQKSTVVSQFRLCSRIDVITPNIDFRAHQNGANSVFALYIRFILSFHVFSCQNMKK